MDNFTHIPDNALGDDRSEPDTAAEELNKENNNSASEAKAAEEISDGAIAAEVSTEQTAEQGEDLSCSGEGAKAEDDGGANCRNPETETEGTGESDSKKAVKLSGMQKVYEYFEMIIVSIAFIFILFAFVTRVAVVEGDSMLDTLQDGNKLIVWELFYTPSQGDIIVCQSEYQFREALVKRVIATEGQTVRIDGDGWKVYVDGELLEEKDYVRHIDGLKMGEGNWIDGEITVPKGKVFVMGDNRSESLDSRYSSVGLIDEDWIMGKVVFRISPFADFGAVK